MSLALIVAASANNVIGKNNQLPWYLPGDLKYFKTITMAKPVIMGRKTFESIGRPLPGRETIIVTRNAQYHQPDCTTASGLAKAIDIATQYEKAIFIIGGGEIYGQALPLATGVHITTVHCEVNGNIYFPVFPTNDFTLVNEKHFQSNIDYLYQHYKRREQIES